MAKKKFVVELLEIHRIPIVVEADNILDAIDRAKECDGDFGNITYEESFLAPATENGISVDALMRDHPELILPDVLALADSKEDFIPGVYSVEEE